VGGKAERVPSSSLEDAQQFGNQQRVARSRVSASNDPHQVRHDANEANNKLSAGAAALAAGRELGLSEEETLSLMSRKQRSQMGLDLQMSRADLARTRAQSQATITEAAERQEIEGTGYYEEPEVNPFGEMQDDSQTYSRDEAINRGLISRDQMTEYELARDAEARGREPGGASAGFADALSQVRQAREKQANKGVGAALSRVFGGPAPDIPGAADLEGRLEGYVDPGRTQADADAALGAETVRRDNRRFESSDAQFRALLNDQRARRAAEGAIHPVYGTLGRAITQANLDRVRVSGSGMGKYLPDAGRSVSGDYIDPDTGARLAYQGLQGPMPSVNDSTTAQQLNAPDASGARRFVEETAPGYIEGGRTFGGFRQVDINGSTQLFSDRLHEMGIDSSSNIRGVDELDRAAQFVISKQQAAGKPFYDMEVVVGADGRPTMRKTRNPDPGIPQVLTAMRYTPAEMGQLASSLRTLQLAKDSVINQQGKQQYFTRTGPYGKLQPTGFGESATYGPTGPGDRRPATPFGGDAQTPGGARVFFDSPEAVDPREGQATPARIRGGQKLEGRDIKTQLGQLPSGGARDLSIGQVQGEKPRINRYNRTGETDPIRIESKLRNQAEARAKKTKKPLDEAGLRNQTVKAQLVQAREDRDLKARADKQSAIIASLPPGARSVRIR